MKGKIIEVELLVYHQDRKTLVTNRKFVGCRECLASMDEFVRWIIRNPTKQVGVYEPNLNDIGQEQYLVATAPLQPLPPPQEPEPE